jgi:hypothetical protein
VLAVLIQRRLKPPVVALLVVCELLTSQLIFRKFPYIIGKTREGGQDAEGRAAASLEA